VDGNARRGNAEALLPEAHGFHGTTAT